MSDPEENAPMTRKEMERLEKHGQTLISKAQMITDRCRQPNPLVGAERSLPLIGSRLDRVEHVIACEGIDAVAVGVPVRLTAGRSPHLRDVRRVPAVGRIERCDNGLVHYEGAPKPRDGSACPQHSGDLEDAQVWIDPVPRVGAGNQVELSPRVLPGLEACHLHRKAVATGHVSHPLVHVDA